MKNSTIKNILTNIRAFATTNLRKRDNDNSKRITSLEEKMNNIETIISHNYLYNSILSYFAIHPNEAASYQEELDYLHKNNHFVTFPYPTNETKSSIITGYDKTSGMPYVIHHDNRLFFPSCYTEEESSQIYSYLLSTEAILGTDCCLKRPHQYQSSKIQIEPKDILFDIGAAEGLFSLDNIMHVKHVILIESDPKWIEALHKTFSPFANKVTIIGKAISSVDNENTITLETLLSNYCGSNIFLKMDIEGEEVSTLLSAEKKLAEATETIKISVASYHRNSDYSTLQHFFNKLNYYSETSSGYMLFNLYDTPVPPFFRHGIIRATNKKSE